MRIIASDPDQVRPLHFKGKKSFFAGTAKCHIFGKKDLGVTKMSSTRHKLYMCVLCEGKNRTANQFCLVDRKNYFIGLRPVIARKFWIFF